MTDPLDALRASSRRLGLLVAPLGPGVTKRAYPSRWTIADVVSHLGSASVIGERRIDDALAGRTTPDEFNRAV